MTTTSQVQPDWFAQFDGGEPLPLPADAPEERLPPEPGATAASITPSPEVPTSAPGFGVVPPDDHAYLQARAVSDDVATERGYLTVAAKYTLRNYGFSERQVRGMLSGGLLIPLYSPEADEPVTYQVRPHIPPPDPEKPGKFKKFLLPSKHRNRLDVHPRVRPFLSDPEALVVVTEGAVKADALISAGYPAASLTGVWNWSARPHRDAPSVPLEDLLALRCRVAIVFDSDVLDPEKNIRQAMAGLRANLTEAAHVSCHVVPLAADGSKQGVDDYLAAGGDFDLLLATEYDPGEPSRSSDSWARKHADYLDSLIARAREGLPRYLEDRRILADTFLTPTHAGDYCSRGTAKMATRALTQEFRAWRWRCLGGDCPVCIVHYVHTTIRRLWSALDSPTTLYAHRLTSREEWDAFRKMCLRHDDTPKVAVFLENGHVDAFSPVEFEDGREVEAIGGLFASLCQSYAIARLPAKPGDLNSKGEQKQWNVRRRHSQLPARPKSKRSEDTEFYGVPRDMQVEDAVRMIEEYAEKPILPKAGEPRDSSAVRFNGKLAEFDLATAQLQELDEAAAEDFAAMIERKKDKKWREVRRLKPVEEWTAEDWFGPEENDRDRPG